MSPTAGSAGHFTGPARPGAKCREHQTPMTLIRPQAESLSSRSRGAEEPRSTESRSEARLQQGLRRRGRVRPFAAPPPSRHASAIESGPSDQSGKLQARTVRGTTRPRLADFSRNPPGIRGPGGTFGPAKEPSWRNGYEDKSSSEGRRTHGLWRSLVSALDWGSRGRRFKSGQPDQKRPGQRLAMAWRSSSSAPMVA